MSRITGEIRIKADIKKVWEAIADLGGIQQYHPAVTKSYYLEGKREGVGAARHCDFKGGSGIDETVIDWREGKEFTLKLHNGKKMPPFKNAIGRQSVRADGDETIVGLTLEYDLKYGPIGALMDFMMVRGQFEKMVPAMLSGLKKHVESSVTARA